MKKLKYLFTILIATIILGCSSNVEENTENENKNYFGYSTTWDFSVSNTNCGTNNSGAVKYYTYNYNTIDQENQSVTCSAYLEYLNPANTSDTVQIDIVIIDCHGTISSNSEAPSKCKYASFSVKEIEDELVYQRIPDDCKIKALLIAPDYLGYGASADKTHPYMITNLCARNIIDSVLSVMNNQSAFKIQLKNGYKSYVIGYSQGGQTSLGTMCAVENYIPSGLKSTINLQKCYSGAGPHDLPATMESFLSKGPDGNGIVYPNLIYLVVKGIMSAGYKCMEGYKLEDFFTNEFLASGIKDGLDVKNINLASKINEFLYFQDLNKLITPDLQNPNSKLHKDLKKALSYNSLASGWTVTKPVYVYHHKDDDMVPSVNIEKVKTGIAKGNNLVECKVVTDDTGKDPTDVFDFIHVRAAPEFYTSSGQDLIKSLYPKSKN